VKTSDPDHFDPFIELRLRTARVCEHFPASYWTELRRNGSYPFTFLRSLTQFRLMGIAVPASCGGAGLGIGAACAVVEEAHRLGCDFGRIDLQYALCFALASQADALKMRPWLIDVASGHSRLQMCNFIGGGVEFSYQVTPEGGRLSGRTSWPERIEHSNLGLLIARRGDGNGRVLVVLEVGSANGVSLKAHWSESTKGQVFLVAKNVMVKRGDLVSEEGVVRRAKAARSLLLCAGRLGDARARYDAMSKLRPTNIVDTATVNARKEIRGARDTLRLAAGLLDRGDDCGKEILLAEEGSQRSMRAVADLLGEQSHG